MVFPARCPVCGRIVTGEDPLVCGGCRGVFKSTGSSVCKKCGKPLEDAALEYCSDCVRKRHEFIRNYAMWMYDDNMRKSIAHFKYHNRPEYAKFYAGQIFKRFKGEFSRIKIEAIVPVPLYIGRKKHRGYNQSQIFATELGKLLKLPVYPMLLRVKKTRPQKELDDYGRVQNLKGAFAWNEKWEKRWEKKQKRPVDVKTILLVDDIYTTGSTLNECAKVIKGHGEYDVYTLTVSIGRGM